MNHHRLSLYVNQLFKQRALLINEQLAEASIIKPLHNMTPPTTTTPTTTPTSPVNPVVKSDRIRSIETTISNIINDGPKALSMESFIPPKSY